MTDPPLPFYRKDLAAFYVSRSFVFFTPHRTGHGCRALPVNRELPLQIRINDAGPDPVTNYLDYGDASCMFEFTFRQGCKDGLSMESVSIGALVSSAGEVIAIG